MPEKTKEELLLIVNTVLKNGGREALDALPLDADLRSDIGFDSFDLAELAVRIQANSTWTYLRILLYRRLGRFSIKLRR